MSHKLILDVSGHVTLTNSKEVFSFLLLGLWYHMRLHLQIAFITGLELAIQHVAKC